jgi:hypothetical protein
MKRAIAMLFCTVGGCLFVMGIGTFINGDVDGLQEAQFTMGYLMLFGLIAFASWYLGLRRPVPRI